jgi:hypothetical protein
MGRAWRGASLLLIAAHGDCNGNAARGQGQPALNQSIAMGNGDGGAQSINCNGALGHWGMGTGAGATGGKRNGANDRTFPLQCSIVWMWAWGVGRGHGRVLFRVFYSKR